MRLFTQLSIITLLAALAAGGWYWTAAGKPEDKNSRSSRPIAPVIVETATVRLGTITETVAAVGATRAAKSVNIVATTAGLVTRIAFEAGQRVEAGAVLFELDSASERAGVREAESEAANLRAQMTRADALYNRKLLSVAAIDELRGKLGMAEARLDALRSQRDKRAIRAPFSGVIGLRNVNIGAYVNSDTALTTLDDLQTIELEFKIPERYFGVVKTGQALTATSAAFPNRLFAGTVRAVDTRIDPATRAFRVRAEVPNPNAVLPEGMFMAVTLVIASRQEALLIPEAALIKEGTENYVYVAEAGAALRTPIALGQRRDAAVEVTAGLKRDWQVVVKGQQSLRDKMPIRTAGQAADASPNSPRPPPS
jgi:membrane fusion protein (multidrug efflux system)